MDYETGVASDPIDLLTKLRTFAASNGWTNTTVSGGFATEKGDILFGSTPGASDVRFRGAIGDASAILAWDNQSNNAGRTLTVDVGAGPYTAYHFFAGDEGGSEYLHGAVEISVGHFRHFVMGQLVKMGAYDGGVYVDGTNWNNGTSSQNQPDHPNHHVVCDGTSGAQNIAHLWIDYDTKTNNWQLITNADDTGADVCCGSLRRDGFLAPFGNIGYMKWNLRNHFSPLHYYANRAGALRSAVGRIPHTRFVAMQNITPGETIDIGGEDWIVFPMIQRTDSFGSGNSSIESSGYYGYAYRLP